MTQSVFYVGTSPTQVMGSDSPDSAGKVYYRLTVQHDTSMMSDLATFGLGFADGLVDVYSQLSASIMVIPTSPQPVDDGSGVAVIDVVVAPQGKSNSVGDLVNLVNDASYSVALYRLERVKLQNVSTTTQASDRASTASSAAQAVESGGIVGTLKSWWQTIEGDLKWAVVGIGLLVVGYIYFTSRKRS